jgi:hypothetical protein
MGCKISSSTSPKSASHITDFAVIARQVKQTWPDVQKIDKLGAKTFAQ